MKGIFCIIIIIKKNSLNLNTYSVNPITLVQFTKLSELGRGRGGIWKSYVLQMLFPFGGKSM